MKPNVYRPSRPINFRGSYLHDSTRACLAEAAATAFLTGLLTEVAATAFLARLLAEVTATAFLTGLLAEVAATAFLTV